MNTDFRIVWDFFARTGPEVIGHGYAGNIWPDAPFIERFISADLTDEEKRELCDFLKTHPHYIDYLVGRLRNAGQLAAPGHRDEPVKHRDEPAYAGDCGDDSPSPPLF